jgi:protease I
VAKLAANPHIRRIVSSFMDGGKPVAAIDDGVSLLAVAQKVKGRTLTGSPAVREALEAAGAIWSEEPITIDKSLVTADGLDNLQGFVDQLVKSFTDAAQVKKAA